MKKLYLLSILLLSGCCSEQKYVDLLNARMGMTENQLISEIGNPSTVYNMNGEKSLEYKYENFFCNQYGCFTHWCNTQYIIKNNHVYTWRYNGNQCCIY